MAALMLICSCSQTIEVGIVTGKSDKYHKPEIMTPHIAKVLGENPNIVTTTLDVNLAENELIDFSKYDAIVMNVNELSWSDEQKSAFESYMLNGGGLVIVHEANNAFPEWAEYNKMIGLGGWGGRDKASGPYYYLSDGEFITDYTSEGKGGKHGKRVAFEITIRDSDHPITRGLPATWMHYDDELYGDLRGPAENIHPLASAFSESESGGTGKEEPVLFTVSYGKGRVFHTVLGHTQKDFDKPLQNVGFNVTLLRGVEWAATGDVKFESGF